MVTNIDNRQDAAKAGLRGKLPRVRGSGPLEWGQAKAKDAKKRILRPDYTNKMFVDTTEPHKLLGGHRQEVLRDVRHLHHRSRGGRV